MRNYILGFLLISLIHSQGVFAQNTYVKSEQEDVYLTGVELYEKQKYGAAREYFSRYLTQAPSDQRAVEARFYLASSALYLFHDDGATLLKNFASTYPDHSRVSDAYVQLAEHYYNQKNYKELISSLSSTDLSALSPSRRAEVKFKLGYAYFTQKEFEPAGVLFNEVKSQNHRFSYACAYYAGYIELKNGDYNAALADLKKAESNPDYKPLVPHMLANTYYRMGNSDELIRYCETIFASGEKIQGLSDMYLMTADAYYIKKEYPKSLEYFNKYLSSGDFNPDRNIRYRIGYANFKNTNYPEAIAQFKDITAVEDTLGQSASYYLGLSYLNSEQLLFALNAFKLAYKNQYSKKTSEEALFYIAKLHFDLQQYHESITPFKTFLNNYPESGHESEAKELLSEAYLRSNNYAEALEYIEKIPKKNTRINTVYQKITYLRAAELFNNGNYAEAKAMFDKSLMHQYDRDIYEAANFWKAEILTMQGEFSRAVNYYNTVLRSHNDNSLYSVRAQYGIGYAYYYQKEYASALPHFKAYVDQLESAKDKLNYNDALLRLADMYYVNKKYADAITYYNRAIYLKVPEQDYAYYHRGAVYATMEKNSEARLSFQQVATSFPNSVYYEGSVYQLAQIDYANENYESAKQNFSKLIGVKANNHPYEPQALLQRARIYMKQNKYEEALKDYEYFLDKHYTHPSAQEAVEGLRDAYLKLDRLDDYETRIREIKGRDPGNISFENMDYEFAKDQYDDQQYAKAARFFDNYLKQYPNSPQAPDARFYLGDSYVKLKRFEEALPLLEKVYQERVSSYVTRALNALATIYFGLKQYDKAVFYYRELIPNAKKKQDVLTAQVNLTEAYFQLSRYDSVHYFADLVLQESSLSATQQIKVRMFKAKTYKQQNNSEKAIEYFKTILNASKDQPGAEAQYNIAELLFQQSKYKESLEACQKVIKNYSDYTDWYEKAYLLLADNLVAQNEIFQARASLNSILQNAELDETKKGAQERLDKLPKGGKQ